ncbi:MAG TPA: glycoside hydrolase family 127 protein, partial [bacterium]|nr:glycoside hydrolase family 127 protein [bacterium]
NGYAVLRRQWKFKDRITLRLPMKVRRVSADDRVAANRGKVAVERGPLVYCAEGIDQPDKQVRHLILPDDAVFEVQSEPGLLNGVHTIRSPVQAVHAVSNEGSLEYYLQTLTLIPYYAWAHRGRTEMSVWLAATQEAAMPLLPPSPAAGARVYASHGRGVEAVNDQIEPASSNDHEIPRYHWWPRKGLVQHLECHFNRSVVVSGTEVYWFDDTGTGECRVPQAWRLLYLSQDKWKPVVHSSEYTVKTDRFNRVRFRPVRTRGLRMEIQSQEGWAGGILEWRIQ